MRGTEQERDHSLEKKKGTWLGKLGVCISLSLAWPLRRRFSSLLEIYVPSCTVSPPDMYNMVREGRIQRGEEIRKDETRQDKTRQDKIL